MIMKKIYISPCICTYKVELSTIIVASRFENSNDGSQSVTIDPDEEVDEFTSRRYNQWDEEEEEEF